MKVYKKDILYGQGDQSGEVFFIIKGRVKFFWKKPGEQSEEHPEGEEEISQSKPDPINLHVEGSYFGDNDVLLAGGRVGRDSTAIAETECALLVITKAHLNDLLKKFPVVRREMKKVAITRKYHL